MGLSKTIVLTVKGFEVTLSEAIGFYKNDAVKLKFNINEYGIDVTQSAKVRTIMPINPLSAKLRIDLPTGAEELESVGIVDNQVEFYLSSKYTRHIGISTMQIRLLDNDGCQVTLPSFTFEIQDSMFRDDEVVVEAVTMLVDEEGHYLVDEKGNVVKVGSTGESKEIRDFTLKPSVDGAEDVLIQDNGVTKRVKASSLKGQQGIQGPKGDKGDPGTTTWEGITNKPTNLATESFVVQKIAEASLSGGEVDLSGYATKDDLDTKADNVHTHVMTDITDLVIPDIDVDKNYVDTQLATKANITDIPTKVSELTNDSGYLTAIPEEYVTDTELESKGYLTEHQDISNLATKAEVQNKADVNHTHSQYLTTIPTEYITETELNDALSTKANTSDIPSLEGYATESYVQNKIAEASLSGGEVDLSDYVTKNDLNTKADKKHTHKVTDITDLVIPTNTSDLTNDSGFVKASELSPVALSGNYNDLINKPTISGGGNVSSEAVINTKSITIDLDKYGIVEGDLSHKAPYSDEEYEIAYNNMEGFKTALNDLSSQGYSKIYLPRGTYIMCYRNPTGTNVWSYNRGWEITIPSHTDFDLNGSTIKVIYDSNNKNPYDLSTADAYKLCGMVFSFSKSYYSTLRNGTILGDRYERSFTNSSEVSIDYTYGVYITNGSSNCKIEDMEISGFMADAIGSDQNHNTDFGNSIMYTDISFTNSSINVSNGTVESKPSSNYVFSSDYIDLSSIIATGCRSITLRTNLGYTYVFDADVSFKVFLYDENQKFIRFNEYDQTDNIPLTSNTKYCKISLVDYDKAGASTISPVFQLTPASPEFLHVANCKIYNNHRGGLSNLPNDTTVERCEIFENGTAGTESFPVFTDTTRYAINCEDHMVRNLVIKNNYIHDGYNGILLTCKNAVITENVMKNFPTSSIYSMYATNITVSNNKFENTKLPTAKLDTTKILASNNFFTNVSATTIQKNMLLNNNVITMKKMSITNSGQLSLNLGVVNEELSTNSITGYGGIGGGFNNTIFNCVNPQVSTYYDVIELASNSSNNIINYEGLASNRHIVPFGVYNSTLTNGKVTNNSANGNTFNLINSTINVKEFWETYYRAPGGSATFNFKNCIINVPTEFSSTSFIGLNSNSLYDGKGVFDITFDGCEINIDNTSFAYLIHIGLWGGTSFTRLNLTIKNCVINNNTSNTLKLFMDGNNHLTADYCTLVLENNTYNGAVVQS